MVYTNSEMIMLVLLAVDTGYGSQTCVGRYLDANVVVHIHQLIDTSRPAQSNHQSRHVIL